MSERAKVDHGVLSGRVSTLTPLGSQYCHGRRRGSLVGREAIWDRAPGSPASAALRAASLGSVVVVRCGEVRFDGGVIVVWRGGGGVVWCDVVWCGVVLGRASRVGWGDWRCDWWVGGRRWWSMACPPPPVSKVMPEITDASSTPTRGMIKVKVKIKIKIKIKIKTNECFQNRTGRRLSYAVAGEGRRVRCWPSDALAARVARPIKGRPSPPGGWEGWEGLVCGRAGRAFAVGESQGRDEANTACAGVLTVRPRYGCWIFGRGNLTRSNRRALCNRVGQGQPAACHLRSVGVGSRRAYALRWIRSVLGS